MSIFERKHETRKPPLRAQVNTKVESGERSCTPCQHDKTFSIYVDFNGLGESKNKFCYLKKRKKYLSFFWFSFCFNFIFRFFFVLSFVGWAIVFPDSDRGSGGKSGFQF